MSLQPILPACSMADFTSRFATATAEMYQRPKYPHYCLIGMALASSSTGEMQVGDIYRYIETNFRCCISSAPRTWKNSVRHCLSSSGYFKKAKMCATPIDCAKKGNQWCIKPQTFTDLSNKIQKYSRKRRPTHEQLSSVNFITSTPLPPTPNPSVYLAPTAREWWEQPVVSSDIPDIDISSLLEQIEAQQAPVSIPPVHSCSFKSNEIQIKAQQAPVSIPPVQSSSCKSTEIQIEAQQAPVSVPPVQSCSFKSTEIVTNQTRPLTTPQQLTDEQLPDDITQMLDKIVPEITWYLQPDEAIVSNDVISTQENPDKRVLLQENKCQDYSVIADVPSPSNFSDVNLDDLVKESSLILDELPIDNYLPLAQGLHTDEDQSCEIDNCQTSNCKNIDLTEDIISQLVFLTKEEHSETGDKDNLGSTPSPPKESDCDEALKVGHDKVSLYEEVNLPEEVQSPPSTCTPMKKNKANNWITKRLEKLNRSVVCSGTMDSDNTDSQFHMYKLGGQQAPTAQNITEPPYSMLGKKRQHTKSIPMDLEAPKTKKIRSMKAATNLRTGSQLHGYSLGGKQTQSESLERNRTHNVELPQGTILGKKRPSPEPRPTDLEAPQTKKIRSMNAATNLRAALLQATRSIRKKCKLTSPTLVSSMKSKPAISTHTNGLDFLFASSAQRKCPYTEDTCDHESKKQKLSAAVTDYSATAKQTCQEFSVTNISPTRIIIHKTLP